MPSRGWPGSLATRPRTRNSSPALGSRPFRYCDASSIGMTPFEPPGCVPIREAQGWRIGRCWKIGADTSEETEACRHGTTIGERGSMNLPRSNGDSVPGQKCRKLFASLPRASGNGPTCWRSFPFADERELSERRRTAAVLRPRIARWLLR